MRGLRTTRFTKRGMQSFLLISASMFFAAFAAAQPPPQYRTFNQHDLSLKKLRAGRVLGSNVCFVFRNTGLFPMGGIHAITNAQVLSIVDSGGFPDIKIGSKKIDLQGRFVPAGDSASFCAVFSKRDTGTKVNFWWWTTLAGTRGSQTKVKLLPVSDVLIYIQPNGGNVRDYLYKKVITRPGGVVIGIPRTDSSRYYGWIRYLTANRKYFPDSGAARCLDFITLSSGLMRLFVGEHKNIHVKRHDNILVGEVHALKLAVVANDHGVSEPLDPAATRLGDLIYSDPGNASDPRNGMTIREIIHLADSAVTYCGRFDPSYYAALASVAGRINDAFDGPYLAETFSPFLLAGAHPLADAPFLHPNPVAAPVTAPRVYASIIDDLPDNPEMRQNYPNPFNPVTTIEFRLGDEPSIVTLKVFNMLGQEVATLLNGVELEGGEQSIQFDASRLTSGVYFYRITAESMDGGRRLFQAVRRMTLLK